MADALAHYLTGLLNGTIDPEGNEPRPPVADETEDPAEAFGRMIAHQLGWAEVEEPNHFESGGATRPGYDPSQGRGTDGGPITEEQALLASLKNQLYRKLGPHGMILNPPETWDIHNDTVTRGPQPPITNL